MVEQIQFYGQNNKGMKEVEGSWNKFIDLFILILNFELSNSMGNTCCEANSDEPMIDNIRQIPAFNDFETTQWLEDDDFFNHYLKDASNDHLKNKQLKKHKYEKKYYVGDWHNDQPTGKGIFYEPDNLIYDGDFHDGTFDGQAKVHLLKTKCVYEGSIVSGQAKGKGTLINEDKKYKFEGEWENSKPTVGMIVFDEDSNVCRIQISDPEAKSSAVTYKDGRTYQGSIDKENYLPDGVGKVSFPPSSSKLYYEGEWKQGQMHGRGKYVCKDGSMYEGDYFENKKEGRGKFTFVSGNVYDGEWKEGKQDGIGVLMDRLQKQMKKGRWEGGKFVQTIDEEEFKKSIIGVRGSILQVNENMEQKNETPQFPYDKNEYLPKDEMQNKEQAKQKEEDSLKKNEPQNKQQKFIPNKVPDEHSFGTAHKEGEKEASEQKKQEDSKAIDESNSEDKNFLSSQRKIFESREPQFKENKKKGEKQEYSLIEEEKKVFSHLDEDSKKQKSESKMPQESKEQNKDNQR